MSQLTVELQVLVWSAVLLFILICVAGFGNTKAMGQPWGMGNRDVPADRSGLGGRASRAYANLIENLVLFGILVIAAQFANIHTSLTVLGAQIFLAGRIAHAVIYTAGWTVFGIRTLAYLVGLAGTIMIFYAIMAA